MPKRKADDTAPLAKTDKEFGPESNGADADGNCDFFPKLLAYIWRKLWCRKIVMLYLSVYYAFFLGMLFLCTSGFG